MPRDSVEHTLKVIENWMNSLYSPNVKLHVNRSPEANIDNFDYYVEVELKITPKTPSALGITIWICSDSIGFFLESFDTVAKLGKLKAVREYSKYACAGTEPVSNITTEKLIKICRLVSRGEINMSMGVFANRLFGIYTTIQVNDKYPMKYSIGMSKSTIELLSMFRLGKVVPIKIPSWKQ